MFCSIHICPQREPDSDARLLRTIRAHSWDKVVFASSLWTPRFAVRRSILDDGRAISLPSLTEPVTPSAETLNHRVSVIENYINLNIHTQEKILLVIDQYLLEHKNRFHLSLEDRLWASQGIVMEVDISHHSDNRTRRGYVSRSKPCKVQARLLDEPDR